MLVIRLKPIGKKHQISYRVVVGERRSKLNGKFVEDLGFYNPYIKEFNLKEERIKYWIDNGAQPSDTVYNLLVRGGILSGDKKIIKIKKSKKEVVEEKPKLEEIKEEEKVEETKTEEAPATEAPAEGLKSEEKVEEVPVEESKVEEVKEETETQA